MIAILLLAMGSLSPHIQTLEALSVSAFYFDEGGAGLFAPFSIQVA